MARRHGAKLSGARTWPVLNRSIQGIGETAETVQSIVHYPLAASARLVASAAGRAVHELAETLMADVVDRDIVLVDEVTPAGMDVAGQQRCVATLERGRVLNWVRHPPVHVASDSDPSLRLGVRGGPWLPLRLEGSLCEDSYLATAQRMLHGGGASQRLPSGLQVTDTGLARPVLGRG